MSLAPRLPLRDVRPSGLWAAMPVEERILAARAVLERRWDEPKLRAEINRAIAEAIRFRPAMVQKLPIDKRAAHLARSVAPDDGLASDLLIALHLGWRRPMLSSFLDHLGIPHQDGLIDDGHEPAPPEPAKLRAAVEALRRDFPAQEVDLYLVSLVAMGPEMWGGLVAVLGDPDA